MEGESDFTRSVVDELHSWDIHGYQKERERAVTISIIDDLDSSYIQREQLEGESCVNGSSIDELHSWDMIKWKDKVLLLEVSLMNFILGISYEMNWKVNVVLLEISLENFILRI